MRPRVSESKLSIAAVQEVWAAAIHSEHSMKPGVLCELPQGTLSRLRELCLIGMSSEALSNEDSYPPRGAALLEIRFHLDALDMPLI